MSGTIDIREYVKLRGGTLSFANGSSPPCVVKDDPVIIGRDEQSNIVVRDKKVSSIHAEFVATEKGTRVRDSGSTNGIFVEGVRCVEAYMIRPSTIQLGDQLLAFIPSEFQAAVDSAPSFGELVGHSGSTRRLFARLHKIAATDLSVLITGETGTGKELVAHGIHAEGARAGKPFEVIDCAAIPRDLVESVLFGHEKGAFTGAHERRESPFVLASGGTIFLDEIGELPLDLQPRLLRVLEARQVKSVGSNISRPFDVRVVAATRRNLEQEVNADRFRSDLYYRLKQVLVEVPALRDRREDIPHLVEHFARRVGRAAYLPRLSQATMSRLCSHDWPGNVREIRNVVESTLALAEPAGPIEIDDLCSSKSTRVEARKIVEHEKMEAAYWCDVHDACGGNQRAMARLSKVARSVVQAKLKKYVPHARASDDIEADR